EPWSSSAGTARPCASRWGAVAKDLRQRFKMPPTRSSRHLVDRRLWKKMLDMSVVVKRHGDSQRRAYSARVQALTSTWRQPRPTEISADLRHVVAGRLRRGARVVRHQERRVGDAYHFPAARTLRGQGAAADSLEIGKRGGAMGARGKPGTGHGIS